MKRTTVIVLSCVTYIAMRSMAARAADDPGLLCRALPTSPPSVVSITPNTTGKCLVDLFEHPRDCRSDQAMHVEVTWETPPTELQYVVQCTLANPEFAEDYEGINCLDRVPGDCIGAIWNIEAVDKDGTEVAISRSALGCGHQQTGHSHPVTGSTYVESVGIISNPDYCGGLTYAPIPDIQKIYPWAAGRCCRETFDQFYFVTPVPGVKTVGFDIVTPLPAQGLGDWRFVIPHCGDDVRSCGEECDDGGTTAFDGCSGDCRREHCGMPNSRSGTKPSASDALVALRAAVRAITCDVCVCDVDQSGAVGASDALRILRRAVDQPATLACPVCTHQHNLSDSWDPFAADSGRPPCTDTACGFPSDAVDPEWCSPQTVFGCCTCAGSSLNVESPYQCVESQ